MVLALGLGSTAAHAQADFQPGYIVQPAGDTVRGEIDYRDARFNNRQCRFRATPAAPVTTFLPTTLRAYGLRDGSKAYRSLVPVALLAPTDPPTPAFLEVFTDGPAQLYTLRDNEGTDHYYVATQTFPLTELVQRKVMLEEERRLQTQNIYRNTLSQALTNCPVAQALLPSLAYTAQALARAVATYNQCQLPAGANARPSTPLAQHLRQRARFGVVLAGSRTVTHGYYGGGTPAYNFEIGPSITAVGGLSFNVPLTQLSNKLSLEIELLYQRQHYNQAYGQGISGHYAYQFDFAYAKLPVLVRYTFPKGRVRPLLEVGPTLSYALTMTTQTAFVDNSNVASPAVGFFDNVHRRLQEGLGGGVGMQFGYWQGRQATLLARYERDTGWSEALDFATWSTHFYGLLVLNISK
ncbi:outer membrane beta-barrel protein [Hymenobacter arcticus]